MRNEDTMALVLTAAKKKKSDITHIKTWSFFISPQCLAVCVSFPTTPSTCQDDFVCDVTLHLLKHRETCEASADAMV